MARAAEERMAKSSPRTVLNERRRRNNEIVNAAEAMRKYKPRRPTTINRAAANAANKRRNERQAREARQFENEQRRQAARKAANNRAQSVLKAANAYSKLFKLKKLINETNGWNKPVHRGPLFGPNNYPRKRNTKLKKN
jgi:aspartate/methionine/tyrosine aminotransferase